MTNTEAPARTAREIAARAKTYATERAELAETDGQYGRMNIGTATRLAAAWRALAAWETNANTVTATVTGPQAEVFGYVAADALDYAGQDLPDTAVIVRNGPSRYSITW